MTDQGAWGGDLQNKHSTHTPGLGLLGGPAALLAQVGREPPQTHNPTIPPPLHHRHKHLRLLMGCLLLCASKRLFVRGEKLILAPEKDAFLRRMIH